MLEKTYKFSITDEKTIEKIVEDDNAAINHVILPKQDALPEHYSNSNVYLIILKGELTLKLNEELPASYTSGDIISIAFNTKMNIKNSGENALEFFIVKAPAPGSYKAK